MRAWRYVAGLLGIALLAGRGGAHTVRLEAVPDHRVSTLAAATHTTPATTEVTNAHPQSNWTHFIADVPILVYHDLGNARASEPYPGPTKPIVIAFDNGYPPQVTEAPRVLSQYGWPGVLNEITEDHLSDAKLKSVLKLGWEIDSHSLTHPDLTALTASELQAQVVQSRQYLHKHLGVPSNSFCYPSSDDNATVEAAVKSAGYEDATTEISSYASPTGDPYQLPRFEMTTDLPQSQADLAEPH